VTALEWIQLFLPGVVAIIGAFAAAWFGARIGFRRSVRERAFDRRLEWHEEVVASLAAYDEVLGRLRNNYLNELVVKEAARRGSGPQPKNAPRDLPKSFRPKAEVWSEVVQTEASLRRSLHLFGLYTDGDAKDGCSSILDRTATLAAGQWFDLGPAPEIPWADIPVRRSALAQTRRILEEEIRAVLEYDSWLLRKWPWLRRRREIARLKKKLRNLKKASEAAAPRTVPAVSADK